MRRTAYLPQLFSLVLVALAPGCWRPPRTNVLLITLDTTRADALGAWSGDAQATPHLDALARSGVRFTNALSTSALTPVSHASILTGLWNDRHGLRIAAGGTADRLDATVPTLATVLGEHGWHSLAVLSSFTVSRHFGLDRGFEQFHDLTGELGEDERGGGDGRRLQRRSDAATDLALEVVEKSAQPFFLWVHYWDPHDEVIVPPAEQLPVDLRLDADGHPTASRKLYRAEVRYVDAQIGRLIEGLRALGRWDDTFVVVVADHGEGLGDHGWWHHRLLYQEQMHVPLIVRDPRVAGPVEVQDVVRTIDIAPTVLECLGIRAPVALDGASLMPWISAAAPPAAPPARTAFADQQNGYDNNANMVKSRPLDDFVYAVVDGGWKLLYRPERPAASELFDLQQDPREAQNLLDSHPDQALRLERLLAERGAWVDRPWQERIGDDVAAEQALAALGYAASDGEPIGPDWIWTCPDHDDVVQETREKCPRCGAPPLMAVKH